MTDPIIGGVGVGVTPDARDFWTRFREQTGPGAAEAGRRAGNDWQRGFNEGAGRPNIRPDVDTTRARAQLASLNRQIDQINRDTSRGGLLEYLAGIAPAIVPIAGAATAGGAALAVMGAQGILAVKGIQSAMADATNTGVQFGSGLSLLKGDLTQLEQTAQRGVLTGVDSAVTQLHAAVPQLNIDLAQSSRVLGSIASSGAGLATGLLRDLSPAVTTVEGDIAKLVRQGAAWANGPGGSAFGQALKTDFQQVEPVLVALLGDVGKLAAAANGPGLGIVSLFGDIATGLEHIPMPVLTALVTGLSAMKVAGVVSTLFGRLRLSVAGAAVAERDAAIAAQQAALAQGDLAAASRAAAAAQAASANVSRLRSFGGAAIGVLGKVAAGYLAVRIAADALSNATASLRTSTNGAQSFLGLLGQGFGDVADGRLTSLVSDIRGSQRVAAQTSAILHGLNAQWSSYNQVQRITVQGTNSAVTGIGRVAGALQSQAHGLTVGMQLQRSYDATTRQVTASLRDQTQALHAQLTQGTASSLPGAFQQTEQSLQKQVDATQKFLSLGGQTVDTYKGVAIGANTYSAALARTNGDIPKATGLIHGMVDNLGRQKLALAAVQKQQARVNTFISDAVLHLTKQANAQKTSSSSSSGAAAQYELTTQQVDLYSQALGINFDRLARSTAYQKAANTELLKFAGALQNGNSTMQAWVQAVDTYNKSAKTAADRGQLLAAALVSFNGDAIQYQSAINQTSVANQQLVKDLKSVHGGIVDVQHGTIDFHKAGAAPLLSDLAGIQSAAQNAAAAMYEHERQTKGATQASGDAARLYRSQTYGVLVDEAKHLGLSADAAHNLAKEYFGIPKDVVTRIRQLGADNTNRLLNALGKQLSYLTGHPWRVRLGVTVDASTLDNLGSTIRSQLPAGVTLPGHARGGSVPEGLSWVGEGGPGARPELLVKHGPDVDVVSHPKAVAFAQSAGIKVPGFAKGTTGSLYALASRYHDWNPRLMAAIAMAESGGSVTAHNPVPPDDSYGLWQINMIGSNGPPRRAEFGIKSNAALYNPNINVRAAHDIWRDQGYNAWTTYSDGAYLQYLGDGGTYHSGGGGTGSGTGGTGGSSGPTRKQRRNHRRHYHHQQVQAAKSNLPGDVRGILGSLDTPGSARSAFGSLLTDMRGSDASAAFIAHMRTEDLALRASIRERIKDEKTLQTAEARMQKAHQRLRAAEQAFNQEQHTVSGALRGGFDITSAGANGNGRVAARGIEAQQTHELTLIRRWVAYFRKLKPIFGKTAAGRAMLRQFAASGPSSYPQIDALAHAGPQLLREILSTQGEIDSVTGKFGHGVAEEFFGQRVKTRREAFQDRRQTVRQDRRDLRHDRERIHREADEIGNAVVRGLGSGRWKLEVGGRGIGRVVRTQNNKDRARH